MTASKRRRVLQVLKEEQASSDVVCEAQVLVEFALEAMLRDIGVDPPKWHDVGPILVEQAQRFPAATRAQLPELARIPRWLRKEREFSFYGDVDFIPTEQYSAHDAVRAITDATCAFEAAKQLIEDHA